jgi:hypothetical protein
MMGRPTIKKTGPMTAAERQARRRKRVGKSMNRQRRQQRKRKKLAPQIAAREARRNAIVIPDGMDLRIGDAREVFNDIPDNSVPLIPTDPPYGNEAEPLYRWLAEFAARALIPGGSLICYTGNLKLNRDFRIFDEHLCFLCLRIMLHTSHRRIFGARLLNGFKPVLHYVKRHLRRLPDRSPLIPDLLKTGGMDKSLHEWGQGDGGIGTLIEHLTEPGEVIIDPFAGPAAWGRIAHAKGRRWIGAEISMGGTQTIVA